MAPKTSKKPQLRGTEPQLPHWFLLVVVPFGISLLMMAVFIPTAIPYKFLGPLGVFIRYLVDIPNFLIGLMLFTSITHTGEAIYAVILCRREKVNMQDTLKWFFLVLLYGLIWSSRFQAHQRERNLEIMTITKAVLISLFLQNQITFLDKKLKLLHFLASIIWSNVFFKTNFSTTALTNLTAETYNFNYFWKFPTLLPFQNIYTTHNKLGILGLLWVYFYCLFLACCIWMFLLHEKGQSIGLQALLAI